MGFKKQKGIPKPKGYDYVGSGSKKNIEARKKSWREKGYSVRTRSGKGRSRRLFVKKKSRR